MLASIILREIHQHILSLRLHLTLILVVLLFGLGTTAFVISYNKDRQRFERYYTEMLEGSRNQAESNLTRYITQARSLLFAPRANSFLSAAKEKYLPMQFWYSGYNVSGFTMPGEGTNKHMKSAWQMDWTNIVAIIISFAVLLFTFDAVSGEKEMRTLAVTLSNPVPRGILIFGKYCSVIIISLLVLLPGIALSLLILLLTGTVMVSVILLAEVAAFLAVLSVFVACMAALGLLASVITRSPNVSLLVCLCIWLGAAVVIPNSAMFLTNLAFPIDSSEKINEQIYSAKYEVNRNAPEGSWHADRDHPFYEDHVKRANNQMNLMMAEKKIKDAWNNVMFRQYERSRVLASGSPVMLFEYLCEAVVGGGYTRLKKAWDDLHTYQNTLLTWFKNIDANDPGSPHWYNPYEDLSTTRKGVSWETVPKFSVRSPTFGERLAAARLSLVLLIIYTALAFAISFVLFLRYDVR